MSEMVERVADALAGKSRIETTRTYWLTMARAAIAAMREPTEAMSSVQYYADFGEKGLQLSPDDQSGIWRAMIDEALK